MIGIGFGEAGEIIPFRHSLQDSEWTLKRSGLISAQQRSDGKLNINQTWKCCKWGLKKLIQIAHGLPENRQMIVK